MGVWCFLFSARKDRPCVYAREPLALSTQHGINRYSRVLETDSCNCLFLTFVFKKKNFFVFLGHFNKTADQPPLCQYRFLALGRVLKDVSVLRLGNERQRNGNETARNSEKQRETAEKGHPVKRPRRETGPQLVTSFISHPSLSFVFCDRKC